MLNRTCTSCQEPRQRPKDMPSGIADLFKCLKVQLSCSCIHGTAFFHAFRPGFGWHGWGEPSHHSRLEVGWLGLRVGKVLESKAPRWTTHIGGKGGPRPRASLCLSRVRLLVPTPLQILQSWVAAFERRVYILHGSGVGHYI